VFGEPARKEVEHLDRERGFSPCELLLELANPLDEFGMLCLVEGTGGVVVCVEEVLFGLEMVDRVVCQSFQVL